MAHVAKGSQCVDLGMNFFKLEIGESPSVCQKNQESEKSLQTVVNVKIWS